jgi:hypothetical protein
MFVDWVIHLGIEGVALASRSCALALCSHPQHRWYRMSLQGLFVALTSWVTVMIIG